MSDPDPNTRPEPTPARDDELPPQAPDAVASHPAMASPERAGDAVFEALWTRVLESWDDDRAHGAILEYSLGSEHLPELAGRYRALKDDPARGERAKKRIDAIVLSATELMMSMKTPARSALPAPIMVSVVGLLLCAIAFVAYSILHRN